MKIARTPLKKARIEIIPMIDTMFFLLVFFMMATLLMTNQQSVPVNLPSAAGMQEKPKQVITLALTQDGKMFYDKRPIDTLEEITVQLAQDGKEAKQLSVLIAADRSVEHGRVVELMDAIQQSGINHIAIAVRPVVRN